MKQQSLYGTPEMVKRFREKHKRADGEMPDFIETLELMEQAGALSKVSPPMPVLNGHMSREEFMESYDKIPFDASMILHLGRLHEKPSLAGAMFRNRKNVVCVQHFNGDPECGENRRTEPDLGNAGERLPGSTELHGKFCQIQA